MNALKQYIDIYREHAALIDSHSAQMLSRFRAEALSRLETMKLPAMGTDFYPVSNLEKWLGADYGLNLGRRILTANPDDVFRCGVPNLPAWHYYVAADMLMPSSVKSPEEGCMVESFFHASEDNKKLISRGYNSIADIANPLVALNTLLCQDGVYVRITKHTHLSKPLQIVNMLEGTFNMMAVRRLLVEVEEGAEASIVLCDHTMAKQASLLSLQTVEVLMHPQSKLQFYDLEESNGTSIRLSSLYASIEKDAELLIDGITVANGNTRNEYFCNLEGSGATLELLGMAIEDGEKCIDTYSRINHKIGNCRSNELVKYVADDKSNCGFEGLILVDEGAVNTESYQANRNLLGSSEAKVVSRPQLEIYNDDVKCSHGSAIGQLDEQQLFYMLTRGISQQQARLMLKQAFMADVVDSVRLEPLRQRLHVMVERRMNGDSRAACSDCKMNK